MSTPKLIKGLTKQIYLSYTYKVVKLNNITISVGEATAGIRVAAAE